MMEAARLRIMDKERDIHAQAWLNVQAKATKQRGKKTVPYFQTFNDFFSYPKEETAVEKQQAESETALKALILKANISNGG
jgi:hypothetical protein